MERTFNFDSIPDETTLEAELKDLRFPLTAEIRQGEGEVKPWLPRQQGMPETYLSFPVHEFLEPDSLYELNALLENGKADGWLKDQAMVMICEEWEEEDLGPEPSLSAAERNPSMVGK
jgi:hypothetical protein